MSKLITITLNTAVDEVLEVTQSQNSKPIVDTVRRFMFPSGKGVNVARAVATLGQPVRSLGFVGEGEGDLFASLQAIGVETLLTSTYGETRVNTTVCDLGDQSTWHIRRPGFSVSDPQMQAFEDKLTKMLVPGDVVVIAGTLPPGLSAQTYSKMIRLCQESKCRVVFDSSETDLISGIEGKPDVIKPNIEELASILGRVVTSTAEIIRGACEIIQGGIKIVIVSRGSEGAVAVFDNGNRALSAEVQPDRTVISTGAVGSGDALVGGVATALVQARDISEALRLGVACGVANMLTIGPAVFDQQDVARLAQKVVLKEIDVLSAIGA